MYLIFFSNIVETCLIYGTIVPIQKKITYVFVWHKLIKTSEEAPTFMSMKPHLSPIDVNMFTNVSKENINRTNFYNVFHKMPMDIFSMISCFNIVCRKNIDKKRQEYLWQYHWNIIEHVASLKITWLFILIFKKWMCDIFFIYGDKWILLNGIFLLQVIIWVWYIMFCFVMYWKI